MGVRMIQRQNDTVRHFGTAKKLHGVSLWHGASFWHGESLYHSEKMTRCVTLAQQQIDTVFYWLVIIFIK